MSESYTPEELAEMRAMAERYAPDTGTNRCPCCAEIPELGGCDYHKVWGNIMELLGDIQRMNGEALAYQTRIENDGVRMAERDAEIVELRKILDSHSIYDSTLKKNWTDDDKGAHRSGWGPRGCIDKHCPICPRTRV